MIHVHAEVARSTRTATERGCSPVRRAAGEYGSATRSKTRVWVIKRRNNANWTCATCEWRRSGPKIPTACAARSENVCEDEQGLTKSYVLHAEANAITKVAKSANNCDGSTLYITAAPCIECSKLIIQAGIKRVVYADDYRSEEGLDLLRRVGIECVQYRIDRT